MRIQYCSDLHLEFEQNSRWMIRNPLKVKGDILILAGDVTPLHDEFLNDPFFNFISDNYKEVFWVPGNHEYYYKDISEFSNAFNFKIRNNVHVVNNSAIDVDNVHFIFSTLWSQISPQNEKTIEQAVSDFDCISKQNKKLKARDFNAMHDSSVEFIFESLKTKTAKTVVVTHHLPSLECNSKEHKASPINEAFSVELSHKISQSNANFWIYGHSHFNQKPIYIGNTVLLTNQLGYVHSKEHTDFKRNAYISL